ncbi:farnesol dehydrogenase [Tribolium castaneum]|uniref:Dehydrogenase/reductase SDR family protein 7-like n=1 Tax=Tribolium castaneum TaxID=7070 RepID=D2A5K3_TRICA|nr:PREDICTED: farnesol dehydrogenase [Tribolium castaneum]EFA05382.1 Dehydrogenase/reductase SDR family protein 7-like [Tribolium castaneum]|eukprot:XP_970128.4 PREDICTED: farnesol dehydrogenase [Tribolium castaneum]
MVVSMDRWVGKVAVVTGASTGIGAAIAKQLVSNGIIVVGIARRVELVQELAQELGDRKGKLHAYKADVSKEDDILKAFKWIEENLGPVHILINNAGVAKETTLVDGDTEAWRNVLDVNVLGLCIATREAIKSMKKHDIKGHIVHINSLCGHRVPNFPGMNIYPASKHAVTALTETLRQELNFVGSKIKITSVSPGLVTTEMTTLNKNLDPEKKAIVDKFPALETEDIADGVIYALGTPEHVQVHELTIKPVGEMY